MTAKLIRIDKNGTKYYADNACWKCDGTGYINGYAHIDGGRCWLCGGTGIHESHWKEYTPEYAQKLADRRLKKALAKAGERNAKFLKAQGFSEDGKTWVVCGDTYSIKDELKEAGAKFSGLFGWHFAQPTSYTAVEINIDEVACVSAEGDYWFSDYTAITKLVNERKAEKEPKSPSDYIAQVGDKVDMIVTFESEHSYETHYTYYGELHTIYKFKDSDGNVLVWNTSAYLELEEGKQYTLKGKVKEHSEYKGEKQTVLTRCKVGA